MLPVLIENLTKEIQKLPGVGKRGAQKMALDILQHSDTDFENLNSAIHQMREKVFFCQNCGFFADSIKIPTANSQNPFQQNPFPKSSLTSQKEQKQEENTTKNLISNQSPKSVSQISHSYNNYLQDFLPIPSVKLCHICQDSHRNPFQICLVEKPTDILNIEKSQIYQGFYHVLNKLISPLDKVFVENTTLPELFEHRLPFLLQIIENFNKSTFSQDNQKIDEHDQAWQDQIENETFLTQGLKTEMDDKNTTKPSDLKLDVEKKQTGNSVEKFVKHKLEIELILFFKTGFSAEATTAYLREKIYQEGWQDKIKITKLAEGLPLYYNPDNLDQATMIKALEDRKNLW
jgi:recombinational DNA repair protein RecR